MLNPAEARQTCNTGSHDLWKQVCSLAITSTAKVVVKEEADRGSKWNKSDSKATSLLTREKGISDGHLFAVGTVSALDQ